VYVSDSNNYDFLTLIFFRKVFIPMFNSDKQNFFIKNHSAALMAVKKNSFSLYLNPRYDEK